VPNLKIQEHTPSTLRNIDGVPPGGAEAEDSGAPTINAKKHRWWAPGGGPHLGSKRCVVNLKQTHLRSPPLGKGSETKTRPELASGSRARSACRACPSGRAVNGCRNLETNAQSVIRTHFTFTLVGHFC
jgi:hypothetical protein